MKTRQQIANQCTRLINMYQADPDPYTANGRFQRSRIALIKATTYKILADVCKGKSKKDFLDEADFYLRLSISYRLVSE